MSKFKSSVLKCDPEEDGCPVCEFLKDNHTVEILLKVIEYLDSKLAEEEKLSNRLVECLIDED